MDIARFFFKPMNIGASLSYGPQNIPLPFSSKLETFFSFDSFILFFQPLLQKISNRLNLKNTSIIEKIKYEDPLFYSAVNIVIRLTLNPTIEHYRSIDLTKGTGIFGTPAVKKQCSETVEEHSFF
jgi:hypothetical protein